MKYKNYRGHLLSLLVVIIPLLVNIVRYILLFSGENSEILFSTNDELMYYKQIESIVSFGMPTGYFGYNGSHAVIGTLGPWGIMVLLPYALFGKIFGWGLSTMFCANIFFLCIANLLFILIADCNNEEKKMLIGISALFHIINLYAATAMSESLRISATIVATAIVIRIWRKKTTRYYFWSGIIALSLCTQINILISALLPIYLFAAMKEKFKNNWKSNLLKLIEIGIISFVYVIINFLPVYLTSSPYCADYGYVKLLKEFNGNMAGIIVYIIKTYISGFREMDIAIIIAKAIERQGINCFTWIALIWWGIVFFTVYKIIKNKRDYGSWFCSENMALWIIGGLNFIFISGLDIMYAGVALDRQLAMLILASALIGMCSQYKQYAYIIIIFGIVSFSDGWVLSENFFADRSNGSYKYEQVYEEQDKLENIMLIDRSINNKWKNTVACYYGYENIVLYLPRGLGLQFMTEAQIIPAKYAFLSTGIAENDKELMKKLHNNGYEEIVKTEEYYLLERNITE